MHNWMNLLGGARHDTAVVPSGGRSVTVEYSLPMIGGPHPAVVLLHGSDGLAASGSRFRLMMQGLAALGYASILPHYFDRTDDDDLGGGMRRAAVITESYPLWKEAIADVIADAARRPEIDAGRLALCGFSLGAFLALGVAVRPPPVRCVIEFCGGLPDELAGRPLTLPPVLILHGDADATVPVSHAHALAQALHAGGVPHETHIYPGQGHLLQGPAERDALQRALAFLETHLAAGGGQ